MPEIIPGAPLHSFLDALRKATSDAFSQALGAPWLVELARTEAAPSARTSVVRFQLSMSGGLQGTVSILVGSGDAILLTQKFGAEPIDPSAELNQDRQEALRGLLRQVADLAANSLKGLFSETKLEVGALEAADGQGADVALLASESSVGTLPLGVRLSPELLASLSLAEASASAPAAGSDVIPPVAHEPNFDLLLGVNLNLTLRFGQRVLPLREILDLTSGSVIELDREVQEPADLLLGDKLIARGEVVIVDGNYGIRITEVADARQRIGTL
jgi:flagellar motor switch protein FliN/FliY